MRVGCVRRSYEEFAWGADEVRPLSKTGVNNNGHVGMTLVDSLDTLLWMNMTAEYARAVEWIAKEFKLDSRDEVSVFEYSVHLLGGLLSAYEMAKDVILLEKAAEVGDLLLQAFDKTSVFPAVRAVGATDA